MLRFYCDLIGWVGTDVVVRVRVSLGLWLGLGLGETFWFGLVSSLGLRLGFVLCCCCCCSNYGYR